MGCCLRAGRPVRDGGDFEALFSDALDALLNAARLATVETWIGRAEARQLSSSTIELAKAELALRDGKHLSAQTFAQSALALAGDRVRKRGGPLWSPEEPRIPVRERSPRWGSTEQRRASRIHLRNERDALWGQLMTSSALELEETHALLDVLEASLDRSDQYEFVRMADKRLAAEVRLGAVRSLSRARRVVELVDQVDDPFARCSFRCNFAYSLNLSAFYDEALEQASLAYADAVEFRVDPVLPYAYSTLAIALAGLGRYGDAHSALDDWQGNPSDAMTSLDCRTSLRSAHESSCKRAAQKRRT